jgi:SAM-dependent methyltransferase/RimJ/RimL family protein N-acetyltransferase
LYGGVYYLLERPVALHSNPAVRLLMPDDEALLGTAEEDLQGTGFYTREGLLREGAIAAAIVAGEIVATAFTVAITPSHAEIGVETLEGHRGQGYATAAAALVAQWIQARGLTPTWSTGADNRASQRVAEKLGFQRYFERTYVIPRHAAPSPAEASAEIATWNLPQDDRPLLARIEAMVEPSLRRGLFGDSATLQVAGLQYHLCGADDTRALAALAEIGPADQVLDIACFLGGPAVQLASDYGCQVTGIDLSPMAIAGAQRIAAITGLADRLRYEVADAAALPYADGSFTVVWNQASLYHQEAWLDEMWRLLAPGGRLAITFDARPGEPRPGSPRWSIAEMAAQWERRGLRITHLDDLTEREIAQGWGGLIARLDAEEERYAAALGHAWVAAARAEFEGEIAAMRAGVWTNGRLVGVKP